MPTFEKYAIVDQVVHDLDEYPDWSWTIKPITSKEELAMSKFLAHRRVLLERGQRVELPPTWLETAFREIALSFGGTTIPKDEDSPVSEGGEPLLKPDASVAEIERVLGTFPRALLMEIWRAVGDAYPYWGPVTPPQPEEEGDPNAA